MSSFEHVHEYYERGLQAAREGRFMAADHFFQQAISKAYDLHGFQGKVSAARHMARIYKDQGVVRMAARHYARALKLMEQSGLARTTGYAKVAGQLRAMNGINLDVMLMGLGIDASGTGAVPLSEVHASEVLGLVRELTRMGAPSDGDCELAAHRLNAAGCTSGRGLPWTGRLIRDLCNATFEV
ncbi:hypothetical protein [Desulfovibrio ferrophilus]|uniref:Tetratricopeptide TPR_2 repeat-containing protein n=1 Tax=Desulfovibrio ferrophilus TaxID=241368 RepID=A0A2Z6AWE1_9BACT|nr:hypothetical protein [Desulfovibrio ferrophilus]BBD07564.1 tetratricopeptide TPR_2 repeat-containing protein [Desulfovibrio ferrophilus]